MIKTAFGVLTGAVVALTATASPPPPSGGPCGGTPPCRGLTASPLPAPAPGHTMRPLDFVATNGEPGPKLMRDRSRLWIDIPVAGGVQRVLVSGDFTATVQRFVR
jgi:hypothetical protein